MKSSFSSFSLLEILSYYGTVHNLFNLKLKIFLKYKHFHAKKGHPIILEGGVQS